MKPETQQKLAFVFAIGAFAFLFLGASQIKSCYDAAIETPINMTCQELLTFQQEQCKPENILYCEATIKGSDPILPRCEYIMQGDLQREIDARCTFFPEVENGR